MKCKKCGKNAENDLCFKCKPKKRLKVTPKANKNEAVDVMKELFFSVWDKRKHESEVSKTYLGWEPLTVFFHHILPKGKYEVAKYDEENIVLLTWEEHSNVEADMYKYEEINKRREYLKIKYNL